MEVLERADLITSTSGMVKWVNENLEVVDRRGVIIGTEVGLADQLRHKYPGRKIFPLFDRAICRTQKLITLPKLCWAIENEQYEVEVPEQIRVKAYTALKRMIDIIPND
jgi:quinolinate synthase